MTYNNVKYYKGIIKNRSTRELSLRIYLFIYNNVNVSIYFRMPMYIISLKAKNYT